MRLRSQWGVNKRSGVSWIIRYIARASKKIASDACQGGPAHELQYVMSWWSIKLNISCKEHTNYIMKPTIPQTIINSGSVTEYHSFRAYNLPKDFRSRRRYLRLLRSEFWKNGKFPEISKCFKACKGERNFPSPGNLCKKLPRRIKDSSFRLCMKMFWGRLFIWL